MEDSAKATLAEVEAQVDIELEPPKDSVVEAPVEVEGKEICISN